MKNLRELHKEFGQLKNDLFGDNAFAAQPDNDCPKWKRYDQLLGYFHPCFRKAGWVDPTLDLFEHYKKQPEELVSINAKWVEKTLDGLSYNDCKAWQEEVEQIGFTFEWGLCAEPFGLNRIPYDRKTITNQKSDK